MTSSSAPAALVLHGGGGPATVTPLADHLAATHRVTAPTHPGWEGTDLPSGLTISALAGDYLARLRVDGDSGVLLVGSSIGGWIALEMALQDDRGTVGRVVLLDSVGVKVPGEPITVFVLDPDTVPPGRQAVAATNLEALAALAGDPYMHDPSLLGRLGEIDAPTLVLWGADDVIVSPAYGAALAAAVPGASYDVIAGAGHLPQLQQPAATFAAIDRFLA